MTNRLFDTNLKTALEWTEGEDWDICNPFNRLSNIYSRIYTSEPGEDDAPNYRLSNGDNFYVGSDSHTVKDVVMSGNPWNFFIDGLYGGEISFYFGLQVGNTDIDSKIDVHSPFILSPIAGGELCHLGAHYHRFYGLKVKGFNSVFALQKPIEGLTIEGIVSFDCSLFDGAYRLSKTIIRSVHLIDHTQKTLNLFSPTEFSYHEFRTTGKGDVGVFISDGHSDVELIAGKIVNEDHGYEDTNILVDGIILGAGGAVIARYIELHGFSGKTFHFDCRVEARQLHSYRCGAGIYIGPNGGGSVFHGCVVAWTRQISGDSYAYYANADCEFVNCSVNLDETGGLGVFVVRDGATITITGGDYRAKLPLPFITSLGDCTVVLDNVRINGTMYNETLVMEDGQSWRGTLAPIVTDSLQVYNNHILNMPYDHIPELRNAVSVQGSDRPFHNVITLPSGAKIAPMGGGMVKYIPDEAWLHLDPGETAIDYFRYSTPDDIYTHKFVINPSPEVGAKLVSPDGLSGSGWSLDDEQYSVTNGNSSLAASVSLTQGKVYQLSVKISALANGSITPQLVGSTTETATYSHSILGTEVWLIRAPANTTTLEIVPNGFTGVLENIYFRELLCSGAVPTPSLTTTVNGNDVLLDWRIVPVARLRDTVTAQTVVENQVMSYSTDAAFYDRPSSGHYRFENVSSSGTRKGISLYSGESLEIYGYDFIGGYTGNASTWQHAVAADQNGGPYMGVQQICYLTGDLLLPSSFGNYNSDYGNSDIIVTNGLNNAENVATRVYILGLDGSNGSDSILDTKKTTHVNHSRMVGSYRCLRVHNISTTTMNNTEMVQNLDTKEAFTTTHSQALVNLWNCTVDGIRCVTNAQMKSHVKGDEYYYKGYTQVTNTDSIFTLKTYPTIHDYARVNMTDMEFQYSTNGGSSWSDLIVSDVGLPGVLGAFKRTVTLPPNTYSFRCRCLNGADVGAWETINNITVS